MSLKVTQIRSAIGTKPKQRGTLRALGLGKIGKTHILPAKPEIRGMINTVPHLIEVEEISYEYFERNMMKIHDLQLLLSQLN